MQQPHGMTALIISKATMALLMDKWYPDLNEAFACWKNMDCLLICNAHWRNYLLP
jgi:hypothetical protein